MKLKYIVRHWPQNPRLQSREYFDTKKSAIEEMKVNTSDETPCGMSELIIARTRDSIATRHWNKSRISWR